MGKMAAAAKLVLACLAFSAVCASDVPVLIWSPDRPLSDLPQAPAAETISQDSFQSKYLAPLLGKQANVIVAFLQDKLHINDISKYADVYNQNSDGGAFKNIKGLLDENFSVELPRVLGSHLALDALHHNFPGTIHHLTSTSDLSGLDLSGKGNYLVIVRLMPVAGAKNEEAAIASNDEFIGKVSKHLEKRSVKYTALYTAEASEESQEVERHQGRHLLEAPAGNTSNGAFYNVTYGNNTLYAYLTSVSICTIITYDKESPPTFCPINFTIEAKDLVNSEMDASMDANKTVSVNLTMNNIQTNFSQDTYNLTLMLSFKHQHDRWEIQESQVSLKNGSEPLVEDEQLVTRGYDTVVPLLYSFHCSSMEWYPKNTTKYPAVYVTLGGFQIQPFNVPSTGFFLSQDCVGWFSTAIWMGLVPVGINLVILFFGMYMMSMLSTNDRFDDPKGKPLTINAGE